MNTPMFRNIVTTLRQANILLHRYSHTNPSMEIVYRELLLRELVRANVTDVFYPVGGAANHSLLYIVARLLNEFEFDCIVELGAGQTSLLIDRMNDALERNCNIRTIEHDPSWAARLRNKVAHEIVDVPLRSKKVRGHNIDYYDITSAQVGPGVDLFIIDGPPAEGAAIRHARLGAFDLVVPCLAEEFVIVIDDCERAGEAELVRMLAAHFEANRTKYVINSIRAAKSQTVFAAGRFESAGYF